MRWTRDRVKIRFMNNRFTIKDFFFTLLLLAVISVVALAMGQFNYQGRKLLSLQRQIKRMNELQLQQMQLLNKFTTGFRAVKPAANSTSAASATQTSGDIRETLPDGTRYVYYPQPPLSPHNPYSRPGYAPGDWLVLNLGAEPRKIQPFVPQDAGAMTVQSWVLESLLIRNPDTLQWEPWLAQSYRQSANGLTITFKLRRGIRFSNGAPITARDVVFSYDTIMNPGVDAAPLRTYLNDVKSCRALNSRTVQFIFKRPYFKALEEVGGIQIIPRHVYKFTNPRRFNEEGGKLVGSGPYMLDRWVRGQEIVLVRNPNYWGPHPTFDRIVYRFIANPQAALQSFLAGQIDEDGPQPSQWVRYTKKPGFTKKYICYKFLLPSYGYDYIGWNLRKPMFKDRRTRTALTMLLNRNAIIKTFLHGLAVQVTGPFNPLSPQNDPRIKPIPYDRAKARALLRQAGWRKNAQGVLERNGRPFQFKLDLPAKNQLIENIASYAQRQFARAGIRMTLEPYEFSVLVHRLNQRKFDAVFLGWTGSLEGDPYQIWDSKSIADKGSNAIGFDDPAADRLIAAGRRELNTAKRMKIWHKLQKIIYRQQPYTFLFTAYTLDFINHRFHNTRPYKFFGVNEGDWYVPLDMQKYH